MVSRGMGCLESSSKVEDFTRYKIPRQRISDKCETVVSALTRLDNEISNCEKSQPAARLAVVNTELETLQQEINQFETTTKSMAVYKDNYVQTLHQIFVSLDLYRRPILASENEDFVANVNRKEMQRLELNWLRTRQSELLRERRLLEEQILHLRSLYAQLQQLLASQKTNKPAKCELDLLTEGFAQLQNAESIDRVDLRRKTCGESIWGGTLRPGTPIETELSRARSLRDGLAMVSSRLRASAEYAYAAVRLLDDALPAWKLTLVGKSGLERTTACADACRLLVQARCLERGARRVLSAHAAPRAARTLRLVLDYAFTDALHDHKYQKATETFVQFKEALLQLINSIHQVLLNNLENLAVAQKDVVKYRRELRATRVNAISRKGLAELEYNPQEHK